ncbi:hypothetical protein MBEHAL_2117 [Halarchaeum acidiphilum MH1-52-1]|uniref:Uncharacterized protein n=1 Tax=Halarchaeum acidiphilum MH1-52-1 TaxID=1261545 RepID=U2YX62_9EURY|nr:hypothetical protein MBEHAL_2117 [Halarchaeum acidiphilum MH1-52-1]
MRVVATVAGHGSARGDRPRIRSHRPSVPAASAPDAVRGNRRRSGAERTRER